MRVDRRRCDDRRKRRKRRRKRRKRRKRRGEEEEKKREKRQKRNNRAEVISSLERAPILLIVRSSSCIQASCRVVHLVSAFLQHHYRSLKSLLALTIVQLCSKSDAGTSGAGRIAAMAEPQGYDTNARAIPMPPSSGTVIRGGQRSHALSPANSDVNYTDLKLAEMEIELKAARAENMSLRRRLDLQSKEADRANSEWAALKGLTAAREMALKHAQRALAAERKASSIWRSSVDSAKFSKQSGH